MNFSLCPVCLSERSHSKLGDYPERMCDRCFFVCSEYIWKILSLNKQVARIATQAIAEALEENRHLADGDDCTLIKLKRALIEIEEGGNEAPKHS